MFLACLQLMHELKTFDVLNIQRTDVLDGDLNYMFSYLIHHRNHIQK